MRVMKNLLIWAIQLAVICMGWLYFALLVQPPKVYFYHLLTHPLIHTWNMFLPS